MPKGRGYSSTGSKKVKEKAKAFRDKQALLDKRKKRQTSIQFLKGARKRGRKNASELGRIYEGPRGGQWTPRKRKES